MATIKEWVEGTMLDRFNEDSSKFTDMISILSEGRIILGTKRSITRSQDIDTYAITLIDKYGDTTGVAGADTANAADRTYLGDTYTLDFSGIEKFEIPKDAFAEWGISPALLNMDLNAIDDPGLEAIEATLSERISSLSVNMRNYRRAQVISLLTNLGLAAAPASQTPLGLKVVDTATLRTTAWKFTNKGTAALTDATLKLAVNVFASFQVTATNSPYPQSQPLMLLHSTDFSTAATTALPHITVNVNNRNTAMAVEMVAGTTPNGIKAVGTYGDTAHPNDWILLGANHKIYRRGILQPGDMNGNGIIAEIYVHPTRRSLVFELRNQSQMVVDSAIDIYKAII